MSLPKSAGEPGSRVPQVGKASLDLGIGKASVDLLVELVDNLNRRVPGCTDALERAGLVAREKFAKVGMSGSASDRVAVVTASARSLPVLMYSIVWRKATEIDCTCPPTGR